MREVLRKPAATLAAWFAFLLIVISPRGDFSISDDWAYGSTVRRLLEGEGLRLSPFAGPAALTHVAWGALFCLPAGFSQTALRLSTLAAAALSLATFHALLGELGFSREARRLGAATLAVNPIFLLLSYTFYTDVLFLTLFIAASWLTLRGLRRGLPWLAAGSGAATLAFLSRQIGLAPTLAAAWRLWREKSTWRRWVATTAAPLATVALYILWTKFGRGATAGYLYHRDQSLARLDHPVRFAKETVARLGATAQYLGLLLAPLGLPAAITAVKSGIPRRRRAVVVAAAALCLVGWALKGPLPGAGDILGARGLGPVAAPGAAFKVAGWWASPLWWATLNAVSLASVVGAAAALPASMPPGIAFLGLSAALAFAPSLLSFTFFDRYVIVLLPWAIAASLPGAAAKPRWAWAGIIALGTMSLAGLQDHLAWNAALWRAGRLAAETGLSEEDIRGGLAWDGSRLAEKNFSILARTDPRAAIRPYAWLALQKPLALLTFNPTPAPGTKELLRVPYRSLLAPDGAGIYCYNLRLPRR